MQYGMGTSEGRASAQPTFFDRVKYIPGMKVDGMDVFAVKQATLFAKEHAINKVSSLSPPLVCASVSAVMTVHSH